MSIVQGRLCRTCAALPFDAAHPPFGAEYDAKYTPTFKLGTLKQVTTRICEFCKLISLAVLRVQRTEPSFQRISLDQEIAIWWLKEGSPKRGLHLIFTSRGSPSGTIVGMVKEPHMPSPLHCSRFYTPISAPRIDFDRVKRWLSACSNYHGPSCRHQFDGNSTLRSPFPGLSKIRFIDVKRRSLVERLSFSNYIALSYVWGMATSFRLTKANRIPLMQPNAITDVWDLLPKTIRYAITVAEILGQRYLWVDSLCLIQNDPQDVESGMGVMDLIYEHSTLTIVAADGKDANYGLPGVYAGSRAPQEHIAEPIPGLRLAVYTDAEYRVESTVYNSRAWT